MDDPVLAPHLVRLPVSPLGRRLRTASVSPRTSRVVAGHSFLLQHSAVLRAALLLGLFGRGKLQFPRLLELLLPELRLGGRTNEREARVSEGRSVRGSARGWRSLSIRTWASLSRVELAGGFPLDDIESIRDTFMVPLIGGGGANDTIVSDSSPKLSLTYAEFTCAGACTTES